MAFRKTPVRPRPRPRSHPAPLAGSLYPVHTFVVLMFFLPFGSPFARAGPAEGGCGGPFEAPEVSSMRAIVVQTPERVAVALPKLRELGANTLVTHGFPDPATGLAARAAGLAYIAWMTTREIDEASRDPRAVASIRGIPNLTGVYYEDDEVEEGYTSPDAQRRAYTELKSLRSGLLVLHPLRLDPIATVPGYLDAIFRPEYTDALVPYLYPVGTTVLGIFSQQDDWESLLVSLLVPVAQRAPSKPVLPVLQAYEETGYPVGAAFPTRQLAAYARVWPGLSGAAAFEWGSSAEDVPFVGFAFRDSLRSGVVSLFRPLARADRISSPCGEDGVSMRFPGRK